MNRTQKVEFVDRFTSQIAEAPLVVLTDYRGATANEANVFRRKLEANGLRLEVVKNTLVRRAIAGTDKEILSTELTGMTGVILSGEDAVGAAKAVGAAIEKDSKIKVKAAFFDGEVFGEDGVKVVSALPGREELLTLLLRTVQAGPQKVMGVIRAPARDLMYLLKNYERKLAEGEAGE